jgi:hypothetical protein
VPRRYQLTGGFTTPARANVAIFVVRSAGDCRDKINLRCAVDGSGFPRNNCGSCIVGLDDAVAFRSPGGVVSDALAIVILPDATAWQEAPEISSSWCGELQSKRLRQSERRSVSPYSPRALRGGMGRQRLPSPPAELERGKPLFLIWYGTVTAYVDPGRGHHPAGWGGVPCAGQGF